MQGDKIMDNKDAKRILICDDDKSVSDFLTLFLKKEGFEVVETAVTAQEALDKIRLCRYQLVLLDIRLPGMDGIQALGKIKEIDKTIDVIMITGFPEEETAREAVKLGAYDYIVKPFDLAYFKLAILTKVLLNSK